MDGLIAIDPGNEDSEGACWVAWFSASGVLLSAEKRTEPLPADGAGWRCVAELPQVYDPRFSKRRVDPKDIIHLTLALGRMTGYRRTEYILPAQWKGQVPCSCSAKVSALVCTYHRRMVAQLSLDESSVLNACALPIPAAKRHNMYDAVCIGLVVLGRLTPGPLRGKQLCQPERA